MAEKKQAQVITETEAHFGYLKGTAKWAKVLKIDDYGKFSIDVYPSDEALEEHIELFEKIRGDAYAEVEAAGKKIAGAADVFREDDEGKKYFQFKLPELNWKKELNKIDMFNDSGTKQEDWDKLVGNGSIVKVKYMAKPYYMNSTKMVGVSYRFYACQVIKLVEYSGKVETGFGDESGDDTPFDGAAGKSEEF